MSSNLAVVQQGAVDLPPTLDREKVELVKQTILKGATDLELQLFVNQANTRRLDPFTKQIYGIKTGQGLQIFASIDGLRVIAQRSGEYAGQVGPLWCGDDGQWADVWLQNTPPAAAKVGVLRKGWTEPLWGVATFRSYGANKSGPVWKSMPDVMLAKCAESIALRKAFPDDLSGLYVAEEWSEEPQAQRDGRGTAETVNQDTGEIVSADALNANITALRERLGWTAQDVIDDAGRQNPPINLRTSAGLRSMVALLTNYVNEEDARDLDEQEALPIDAAYRLEHEGEAGDDEYSR